MVRSTVVAIALAALASACGEIDPKAADAGPTPDAAPTTDGNAAVPDAMEDLEAPETELTAVPDDPTAQATFDFAFTADEPGTFMCRVDAEAFAACSSPHTVTVADGEHTFEVYAIDEADNADETPASHTWTVDTTAPDTTITLAPAAIDNSVDVTFEFTADESPATFECQVDGGAFAACSSPHQVTGLSNGAHSFAVRAIDQVGNTDASPAEHDWTIDTSTPDTQILSGPSGSVTDTDAEFTFSSPDAPVTFECRLDAGAWGACTSPASYTGLAEGSHTFEVRAINATSTVDPTPASRTWTIDLTAPDTTIDSGPSGTVGETSGTFTFSSDESPVTFECRTDSAAFAPCTSPHTVSGLTHGSHTFRVRAVDAADNVDPSPASRTWTVDLEGPTVTITSGPVDLSDSAAAQFSFTASEAGSTFECSVHAPGGTPSWQACTSPQSYTGLSDGDHTFAVRGTDPVGNTGMPATWDWSIDTDPPTTAIDTAPASPTNLASISYAFSADESPVTYQCSFVAQGNTPSWSACTSPRAYSPNQGDYTFSVRATDAASNVGPAVHDDVTIDRTGPTVTINSGPSGPTASTTATFGFTTEAGATLECSLDSTTSWGPCDSATSHTVTNLSQGDHTFRVRATDAADNTGSPASRPWTVDTVGPTAVINSGPASGSAVNYGTATFSVQPAESGVTYECSLNGGTWTACSSPYSVAGADYDASNTFSVRARDSLDNLGPSDSHVWTVQRGLILYYPFNGDAKNYGALGSVHDGQVTGKVAYESTPFGMGAAFDGNSAITLPNTRAPLGSSEQYTIGFWYYHQGESGRLFDNWDKDGCVFSLISIVGAPQAIRVGCGANGSNEYVEESGFKPDAWIHVGLQYKAGAQGDGNGAPVDVYIGGRYFKTIPNTDKGDVFGAEQALHTVLGANTSAIIDELRIYNQVFSQAEYCTEVTGGTWVSGNDYCDVPRMGLHLDFDDSPVANEGFWGTWIEGSQAPLTDGKLSQAVVFDAQSAMQIGNLEFSSYPNTTLGFWFFQTQVLDAGMYFDFVGSVVGTNALHYGGMSAYNASTEKEITTCSAAGSILNCEVNAMFSLGSWHHLMYVVRASAGALDTYLDGVLVNTRSVPSNVFTYASSSMNIAQGWAGYMDDFRVFTSVLNERQRCLMMLGGVWEGGSCALP